MSLTIGDTAPDFEAETTEGTINFHDWIGDSWAVLFSHPAELHPGLHDRARLHGERQAGVRRARRQDHRPLGRPDREPRRLGQGHRGDPGHGAQLPDHRRPRVRGLEGLRDAARRHRGRPDRAHPGRQPDGPQRVRDRARQEDQADPRLSDDHRPQLRRGAAGDRLAAAHRRRTRSRRRSTGSRATT